MSLKNRIDPIIKKQLDKFWNNICTYPDRIISSFMKKHLLTFGFLFIYLFSFSQESHVVIKGKVENELKEQLMNCNLQLFKDDNLVKVDTTGPSGMYHIDSLYVGHVYDLFFEAEGYSLKFVRIDVKDASLEDLIRFPLELNMALFSTVGIHESKLYFLQSEPYAIAKYNKETQTIEWDLAYLEKMKKKVDSVRK